MSLFVVRLCCFVMISICVYEAMLYTPLLAGVDNYTFRI